MRTRVVPAAAHELAGERCGRVVRGAEHSRSVSVHQFAALAARRELRNVILDAELRSLHS